MKYGIEKLKIGVVGLTDNAGASLVAVYLARYLGGDLGLHPALVELNRSCLFDSLSLGKYFAGRDFFPFFSSTLKDESIRARRNLLYGVNWAVKNPAEYEINLNPIRQQRLLNNISGNPVIGIMSHYEDDQHMELLKGMEILILVIDPLPSRLLSGYEFLCKIRASGLPVIYLINKMNQGVSKRELLSYLKVKNLLYLPMIAGEHIYGAEYSARMLYDVPQVKKQVLPTFQALAKEIMEIS